MKKPLTISIIIPAFNEQDHIRGCLESIAAQSVAPDEVIVVDNNSTDQTRSIASSYPFVTVVTEPKQGLIAARNKGFSKAHGDILGRINAEAQLDPHWVETAKLAFQDKTVAAITGPGLAKNLFYHFFKGRTSLYLKSYLTGAGFVFGVRVLWGANMALRRKVWEEIKDAAHTNDTAVHEDQDLSLLIAARGYLTRVRNDLLVTTDKESYMYWPKLKEYWLRGFRTRRIHKKLGTYASPQLLRIGLLDRLLGLLVMFVALWVNLVALLYYGLSLLAKPKGWLRKRLPDTYLKNR